MKSINHDRFFVINAIENGRNVQKVEINSSQIMRMDKSILKKDWKAIKNKEILLVDKELAMQLEKL
jgi:hypothetical protein